MTGSYYAITRQHAEWVYVCSGPDPAQVYHDALEILQGLAIPEDELVTLSPATEKQLDNLRVVPEPVARQQYQVKFTAGLSEVED